MYVALVGEEAQQPVDGGHREVGEVGELGERERIVSVSEPFEQVKTRSTD